MKKLVLIAALVPLLVLMGSSAHSQIIEEIPYPSPTPVQRTPSPSPTQTPVASPTPVVSPSPIASPSPSPSPSPAARLSFQIKCRIELSGVNGGSTVRGQTNIFDFIPGSGFSDADVSIVFGTYTVYAGVTLGQPYGSTSFEPTLNVELYHGGDPVGGMENMTALQGLSLKTWAIGRAQTLIGTKFLRDQRGAGGFSRTDYACALTRIR